MLGRIAFLPERDEISSRAHKRLVSVDQRARLPSATRLHQHPSPKVTCRLPSSSPRELASPVVGLWSSVYGQSPNEIASAIFFDNTTDGLSNTRSNTSAAQMKSGMRMNSAPIAATSLRYWLAFGKLPLEELTSH